MTRPHAFYDVFISYAQHDVGWAAEVQRAFENAGLRVYNIANTQPGENVSDAVWEALAESAALVALVTAGPSDLLLVEIGAAMAWHKPVYVLYRGRRPSGLPNYVEQYGVHPESRIERVIELVNKSNGSLSEEQRRTLSNVYESIGVPTDQLMTDPKSVEELTRRFNKAAKTSLSGERLLREMLRLRKVGQLPRLHKRSGKPKGFRTALRQTSAKSG
jgi:hypothetical protein